MLWDAPGSPHCRLSLAGSAWTKGGWSGGWTLKCAFHSLCSVCQWKTKAFQHLNRLDLGGSGTPAAVRLCSNVGSTCCSASNSAFAVRILVRAAKHLSRTREGCPGSRTQSSSRNKCSLQLSGRDRRPTTCPQVARCADSSVSFALRGSSLHSYSTGISWMLRLLSLTALASLCTYRSTQ